MDSYQDDNFPVHIELGRKVPDYGDSPMAATTSEKKPKKTRTVYPSLYFDDIPSDLFAKLKKTGWALIEYKRRRISIEDNPNAKKDGEESETASGSVDVLQICLPEGDGDIAEELASFAKKKGIDTEGIGRDSEDDDEEESDDEES